jgi:uncharacterized protein (TIGR02757 family)
MAYLYKGLTFEELKTFLDEKVLEFNQIDFLKDDPLGIVHEFQLKQDQEIMGLFMATLAWGNRKSIIKSGENLIQIFGNQPYEFVMNHSEDDLEDLAFVHRTFQKDDLSFFIRQLKRIYVQHDSLEKLFQLNTTVSGARERIVQFRQSFIGQEKNTRTEKHIANPLKNSASKRLNMYMRWMVRQDNTGVDLGLWKTIPMSDLCVPLDVHTGNIAREFGLIQRKQNDWIALEEMMSHLRKMDSFDPCKYDFALFGLGAIGSF